MQTESRWLLDEERPHLLRALHPQNLMPPPRQLEEYLCRPTDSTSPLDRAALFVTPEEVARYHDNLLEEVATTQEVYELPIGKRTPDDLWRHDTLSVSLSFPCSLSQARFMFSSLTPDMLFFLLSSCRFPLLYLSTAVFIHRDSSLPARLLSPNINSLAHMRYFRHQSTLLMMMHFSRTRPILPGGSSHAHLGKVVGLKRRKLTSWLYLQ